MSERISPDAIALQIRRSKITIAKALAELSAWQLRYADWEPVDVPVCRETMRTLRHLETGLSQLRTFLREQDWPSPPSPLPGVRPVWNLLEDACEWSNEAAIAVRSYLPICDSEEEPALRTLLNARKQLEALGQKVNLFLEWVEKFYPGENVDDYQALLSEIGEALLGEQSLQDLVQEETRVLILQSNLCTMLGWIRTGEGKDKERLAAAFQGKDRETVIDALENALKHVYVALDVLAHEREARIDEFAVWRKQAYAMLAECRKWINGVIREDQ